MPPPGLQLYFLAIVPPQPVKDEIRGLKEYFQDRYKSKASLNSPPHITLHMPFQWKPEKELPLIKVLTDVAATLTPFDLQLKNFGAFEPRVIFIGVAENPSLMHLQRELMKTCRTKLQLLNAQYRDLPFHPHITLAFRDLKKAAFVEAWQEFGKKEFEASFQVKEFCLLKHDGRIWNEYRQFSLVSGK